VYEQNLEKVQAIMNENIEKCALKSIDQLADALDTTNPGEGSDEMDQDHEERVERGINANIGIYEGKGENKVIINKKSMRKQKHGYRMKAIVKGTRTSSQRHQETSGKPRPRFHCSF
jgi:hypothetical protein